MKNLCAFKVSVAAAFLSAAVFAAEWTYSVSVDNTNCIYRCGERATYTVTVLGTNGQAVAGGTIRASIDNFGSVVQTNATIDLAKDNPFRMSGTLREPGFLRLVLPTARGRNPHAFGVGFEPERIVKGSPSPVDFDAFWDNAVRTLDETVPPDPKLVLIPERTTDKFKFWRISFASFGGTRAYGYLSMPVDASATKKYPVRFEVPAAGGDRATWTNNMRGAPDAICMLITVHPFEPPFDIDEFSKLFKANEAGLKERFGANKYFHSGIDKAREDFYFYRAILGANRAVNWLAARPEVDLSSFTYSGTSQGGGFGFYLLGLNRHFTKGVMYVPAITDTMGYLKGRVSGWPRSIEELGNDPVRRAAAERNEPYFDGANFASRIRCPVRVAVGFSDVTCPPCAVYAAFNAIPVADKKISNGIWMTHSCFGRFYSELGAWQRAR